MTYVHHTYGHNRKEIRALHYQLTRKKNLLKHHEKRVRDVQASIEKIEYQLSVYATVPVKSVPRPFVSIT